jgi:hypothetical protein
MALGQKQGFGHSIGMGGVSDWVAPRRNAMLGLASGLLASPDFSTGMSVGFDRAAQGRQQDDAYATQQKAEAERQKQIADAAALKDKYANFFMEQNRPDIAQGIADGIVEPGAAYMDFITPKDPTKMEFRDVNGDIIGLDPYAGTSQVVYDGQPPAPAAPSGYRVDPANPEALTFVPGGPADPANKRGGGMPSATLQKEIFETDEGLQAGEGVVKSLETAMQLNGIAWDGPIADIGSSAAALMGNQQAVATQQLKNIVTTNALESLKAIFGSMPTEGERKILLEVQGSINQPRDVRQKIFEAAKKAAERRNEFNKKKAQALRSGDYFSGGFSPVDGASDPNAGGDFEVLGVEP